jgi:4'-phosphopantetheinyl transferase
MLRPGELRWWAVRLDRPVAAGELALLDDEERARADRFHFPQHRRRFVLAHVALRRLLAVALEVAPDAIAYRFGPQGKPALAGAAGERLEFNLAHSGELAVVALSAAEPVGIDLEAVRPGRDLAGLAAACLAPAELAEHGCLAPPARPADFYRRWVCKEAALKALGCGLSLEPRAVVVDGLAAARPRVTAPGMVAAAVRSLTLLDLPGGYVGALAVVGPGLPTPRFSGWLAAPAEAITWE